MLYVRASRLSTAHCWSRALLPRGARPLMLFGQNRDPSLATRSERTRSHLDGTLRRSGSGSKKNTIREVIARALGGELADRAPSLYAPDPVRAVCWSRPGHAISVGHLSRAAHSAHCSERSRRASQPSSRTFRELGGGAEISGVPEPTSLVSPDLYLTACGCRR